MYQKIQPLFLICETPLHVGTGSDLGVVDLPIQRERHTGFPKIESSSLKGAMRHHIENADTKSQVELVFGPEQGDLHAGALGFSDARLLLFPVKSVKGVFAYITCCRVLQQFERDVKLTDESFKITGLDKLTHHQSPDGMMEGIYLSDSTKLKVGNYVMLEEYTFKAVKKELKVGEKNLGDFLGAQLFEKDEYWKDKVSQDIIVLSDNDFGDFVNLSTEVITRTKIDNKTGTVETGALFTEEYLPSDSVMYNLMLASKCFSKNKIGDDGKIVPWNDDTEERIKAINEAANVLNFFKSQIAEQPVVQVGGNATLGKGFVRPVFLNQ